MVGLAIKSTIIAVFNAVGRWKQLITVAVRERETVGEAIEVRKS